MQRDGRGGAGALPGTCIGGRCVVPPTRRREDADRPLMMTLLTCPLPDIPTAEFRDGSQGGRCA